jgi:hypothetical protein
MRRIALVVTVLATAAACQRAGSAALNSAHGLGQTTAEVSVAASEADRAVLDRLTFEPVTYQGVRDAESLPSFTRVCAVKYVVSPERWGIVPDLAYACENEHGRRRALDEAKVRLQSRINAAATAYDARLQALRAPETAIKTYGPTLVYARSLGVDFDLAGCVETVSRQLSETAGQAAALQCDTFLDPGPLLDDFRKQLGQAAERGEALTTVSAASPPPPALSAETAARCQAIPAASGLGVPGSASGALSLRNVAYPIRMAEGQRIDIRVASDAFDTELWLYDSTCSSRLARDDDGGDGTNSRVQWTPARGGDFVVVVAPHEAGGRGAYTVTVSAESTTRSLTDPEREALRAFVEWVKSAPPGEILVAWQGRSGADLQLACLNRERFQSEAGARAARFAEATASCVAALKEATEARKLELAAQGRD